MDSGTSSRFRKVFDAVILAVAWAPLMLANLLITALLRERPHFLDPAEYGHLRVLQENFPVIRAELEQLRDDGTPIPGFADVDHGQSRLDFDGRWKTYVFRVYGQDVRENWARCPQTAKLVTDIPDITMAMFSILEPGKRLPAHFGAYRGVLRYYLPLIVPDPEKCALQVGGEVRVLHEGEALLFDDLFLHTAWNESDADRTVLFIDVERRMPYAWLGALNRRLIAYLSRRSRILDAARNAVVAEA